VPSGQRLFAFWAELNRLTAEFDAPGRFICLPGYEWSGNPGMGGDRNILFRQEGRPICTADELFRALEGEDRAKVLTMYAKKSLCSLSKIISATSSARMSSSPCRATAAASNHRRGVGG
jgi:hypothetical protein